MKTGLLFVAMALQTFFVLAESFVWKGASGGSWDEASNWEGNLVPNVAGADVVFNTEGTLSVLVPSTVTVGTVRVAAGTVTLEGTQDFVLSGGVQPGFDVAAGATLTLNLHPAGSSGLVKTGSGTLNMPLDMAGRYTGTTVARGGTFVLKPRTAGSGEVAPGDALLIETGAVFRQEKSDMLPARYRVTVDGGQYVGANNVCDYLGSLTVRNGGSISGFFFLLIDDAETQRVTVDAGTATISCPLAIGSQWGSYGKKHGTHTCIRHRRGVFIEHDGSDPESFQR